MTEGEVAFSIRDDGCNWPAGAGFRGTGGIGDEVARPRFRVYLMVK